MPIQPTTSGISSSPTTSSPAGPHNSETRKKRARSTSSTSTNDSSSHPSASKGYNTAQSSSRNDIFFDGSSALPPNAVDCPVLPVASPSAFVANATQDVHLSNLHLPIPSVQPQRVHTPAPPTAEDTLRTSLQRFAEFDRQIAALRTSLAATHSSPLPTLGPSVNGDPIPSSDHWRSTLSNFLSNGSSGLPSFTATDPASSNVAVAPSETLNSFSIFASSNGLYATHLDQLQSINAPPLFHFFQILPILHSQPRLHPVVSPLRRSLPIIVILRDIHLPFLSPLWSLVACWVRGNRFRFYTS